jgi:hypothetical protein
LEELQKSGNCCQHGTLRKKSWEYIPKIS